MNRVSLEEHVLCVGLLEKAELYAGTLLPSMTYPFMFRPWFGWWVLVPNFKHVVLISSAQVTGFEPCCQQCCDINYIDKC